MLQQCPPPSSDCCCAKVRSLTPRYSQELLGQVTTPNLSTNTTNYTLKHLILDPCGSMGIQFNVREMARRKCTIV